MAKAKQTKTTITKREAEFDRGYAAFMRRAGTYALAHEAMYADQGAKGGATKWWTEHAAAGRDDQPETEAYRDGYETAQRRMHRECGPIGFGGLSPRTLTCVLKTADAIATDPDNVVPFRRRT